MTHRRYSILLVEDDQSLGYLLTEYLQMKGFDITWVRDGEKAIKVIQTAVFDLAILDVMMPQMDGFTLAKEIKASFPKLPFLFLTAKSLKIDVLRGFAAGAVDYLKKPIDEEELVARIEALLKRLKSDDKEVVKTEIFLGKYLFNFLNQDLTYNGETIRLTARENGLLQILVSNKNILCSHRDILLQLWGKNDYFNRKSLNVFVTRLRKYLERDPSLKIENVHGRGFILRDNSPEQTAGSHVGK